MSKYFIIRRKTGICTIPFQIRMVSLFLLILWIFISGCASIFSKSNYPISINSNPDSAGVLITDKMGTEIYKGSTPAIAYLKASEGYFKKASYRIKISKAGYNEMLIPIEFKIDGWYWGNIIFGGMIGMLVIDPATGAMFKLENDYVHETLTQTEARFNEPHLKIIGMEEIPFEWKAHLVQLEE